MVLFCIFFPLKRGIPLSHRLGAIFFVYSNPANFVTKAIVLILLHVNHPAAQTESHLRYILRCRQRTSHKANYRHTERGSKMLQAFYSLFDNYSFLWDTFRLAQWLRSNPSTSLPLKRRNKGMQIATKIP